MSTEGTKSIESKALTSNESISNVMAKDENKLMESRSMAKDETKSLDSMSMVKGDTEALESIAKAKENTNDINHKSLEKPICVTKDGTNSIESMNHSEEKSKMVFESLVSKKVETNVLELVAPEFGTMPIDSMTTNANETKPIEMKTKATDKTSLEKTSVFPDENETIESFAATIGEIKSIDSISTTRTKSLDSVALLKDWNSKLLEEPTAVSAIKSIEESSLVTKEETESFETIEISEYKTKALDLSTANKEDEMIVVGYEKGGLLIENSSSEDMSNLIENNENTDNVKKNGKVTATVGDQESFACNDNKIENDQMKDTENNDDMIASEEDIVGDVANNACVDVDNDIHDGKEQGFAEEEIKLKYP